VFSFLPKNVNKNNETDELNLHGVQYYYFKSTSTAHLSLYYYKAFVVVSGH